MRILGALTRERLALLQRADAIVADEVPARPGWYERLWQSFAVLLPVQSVGVMGDARTYEFTIAVRAVESLDGMTADWARLPHDLLASISSRIVNEVQGHQPGGLRHQLEAAQHDRVGVDGEVQARGRGVSSCQRASSGAQGDRDRRP